jgi:hypothetical protein
MKAKHTSGPWTVEDPMGPDTISIVSGGDRPVYEWRHVAYLSTNPHELEDDIPTHEAEANARLISAAPELLAALKDATFALALIAEKDGNEQYLNAARAAITKATGGEA